MFLSKYVLNMYHLNEFHFSNTYYRCAQMCCRSINNLKILVVIFATDSKSHTDGRQTKGPPCNEVKFANCWYEFLKLTFRKLCRYRGHVAKLHLSWNLTLCCKLDIVFLWCTYIASCTLYYPDQQMHNI